MSERNKKRIGPGWVTVFVLMGLVDLALLIKWILKGTNVTLFNPQGLIAHDQHSLFVLIVIMLCFAAVPTVLVLYFIAWKFRESNTKAKHTPEARHGRFFVFSIWAYPVLCFFIFASILIPATHKLEPRKALVSNKEPLKIQVIALRWKWLFLYPDQQVASVNFVKLPTDRPVAFDLTADDAPMSSFWIPNIGGQLYAMTGHSNRLNLLADKVGDFPGSTAEINGSGFAGMTFKASVGTPTDFDMWVKGVRQNYPALDSTAYDKLVKPSEDTPPAFFNGYQSDLYDTVLMKYMGHMHETNSSGSTEHEAHE
jgi:cytochrome o ubiquinol oxidase subunit 2